MLLEKHLRKRFEEDRYSDSSVLTFNRAWEQGWFGEPKSGPPPFSRRRVRLAEKRTKRRLEEVERERWAEKMRKKAERKAAREAKALEEKKAPEEKK
jgi:hypothetical protein